MVRDLADTTRSRDNLGDEEELATQVRIWYCSLPAHFGAIPDDKAKECLEKECIHLCFEVVQETTPTQVSHPSEG